MKISRFLQISALVLIAAGVQPAYSAFWEWSKTAATNAGADPSINWAEGMSPSSVNDSARAMMARAAEYRDDISGLLVTTGTATAYAVTTNQGLNAVPNDGQLLAFTPNITNSPGITLTADGGTVYPILAATGTPVGGAVLLAGSPYEVKFSAANSAWMLRGFYGNPFVIPVGGLIDYLGTTSPNSNLVFPVGQCISRTTYATFFALVGTRYGVCDGTTTFAVPNFAGQAAVANDAMSGSPRGLITVAGSGCDGTLVGGQCGSQNIPIQKVNLPNYNLDLSHLGFVTTGTNPLYNWNTSQFGNGLTDAPSITGRTQIFLNTTFAPGSYLELGGSGTPLVRLPPMQIVNKLLRIF